VIPGNAMPLDCASESTLLRRMPKSIGAHIEYSVRRTPYRPGFLANELSAGLAGLCADL
jgi:hypothetical protein